MTRQLITLVLIIVIVYGLMEAWPLLAGPSLHITSPLNNATYADGIVTIEGRAKQSAQLTLNGATLLRDQNGDFSSTLTFPSGGTILTFVATDRFGRTVKDTRSIYVQ